MNRPQVDYEVIAIFEENVDLVLENIKQSIVGFPDNFLTLMTKLLDCEITVLNEIPFDITVLSERYLTKVYVAGIYDILFKNSLISLKDTYTGLDQYTKLVLECINTHMDNGDDVIPNVKDHIQEVMGSMFSVEVDVEFLMTLLGPVPKAKRFTTKEYEVYKALTNTPASLELIYSFGLVGELKRQKLIDGQADLKLSKSGINMFRYVHHKHELDMEVIQELVEQILTGTLKYED